MKIIADENPADSCRTIVEFIKQHANGGAQADGIREALIEDLCWKATRVETSEKAALLAQGMYYMLPPRLRELFPPDFLGLDSLINLPSHLIPHRHVGIVTVLKVELEAVSKVFGVRQQPTLDSGMFRYWSGELERADGLPLSTTIMTVGEPRNVPCAIAVEDMLNRYSIDLMMMVGIAAGPRDKVELGDVVAANWVYDYEHVRRELDSGQKVERPRPFHLQVPHNVRTDLNVFEEAWMNNRFTAIMRDVDLYKLPVAPADINPKFHIGTIAAGEKLFADGSLNEMRLRYDEEIRAGDQEDSGFAQACDFRRIPWCIFRGIADYGDPTKEKGWHFTASLAAASAAFAFLQHAYRMPSDLSI